MTNQEKHLSVMHILTMASQDAVAGYWTHDESGYHLDKVIDQLKMVCANLGYDLRKRPVINAECKAAHDKELAALAEAGYMDISEYVMGR